MSYAEQKWTVDQISEILEYLELPKINTNFTKIYGIYPRGRQVKTITGTSAAMDNTVIFDLQNIHGYLIYAYLKVLYTTRTTNDGVLTCFLDEKPVKNHVLTYGNNNAESSLSVDLNNANIFRTDFEIGNDIVVNAIEGVAGGVVNYPLEFFNSFKIVGDLQATGTYQRYTWVVNYITDP